jgi:DNA repair photolyase
MGTQYIPYKPKKILNTHKHADSWFWDKYSAHPYVGCEHGCEYCYSRETKYLPYINPADFSKIIKIKENAPELLRKATAYLDEETKEKLVERWQHSVQNR